MISQKDYKLIIINDLKNRLDCVLGIPSGGVLPKDLLQFNVLIIFIRPMLFPFHLRLCAYRLTIRLLSTNLPFDFRRFYPVADLCR